MQTVIPLLTAEIFFSGGFFFCELDMMSSFQNGRIGVDGKERSRTLIAAMSSKRFTLPENLWQDKTI